MDTEANTAALGTVAFTVDSSSEEGDFIRPRTPGTIGLSEVMPRNSGETDDQYFNRFENTWELDPDRPGLVRRKAQVSRGTGFSASSQSVVTDLARSAPAAAPAAEATAGNHWRLFFSKARRK